MHKQKNAKDKEAPSFHPISALPLIASVLDGQLAEAQKLFQALLQARSQPHVLDDATIGRLTRAYTEALDHVAVFDEQLKRWRNDPLTDPQAQEVERLTCQAQTMRKTCHKLLELAKELQQGTINRIIEMSDEEIALKVLAGELKLPKR